MFTDIYLDIHEWMLCQLWYSLCLSLLYTLRRSDIPSISVRHISPAQTEIGKFLDLNHGSSELTPWQKSIVNYPFSPGHA